MKNYVSPALVGLALVACRSIDSAAPVGDASVLEVVAPEVVVADQDVRTPLWKALSSLEGRWVSETPYGAGEHLFEVSSGGSVVREIMGPGTESEMTNMYSLAGNGISMTHYCAVGNQPHMHAASMDGNRLVFELVSVGDFKDAGGHYMGPMTLVFVDEDHVEQHWTSNAGGKVDEMGAFVLTRIK